MLPLALPRRYGQSAAALVMTQCRSMATQPSQPRKKHMGARYGQGPEGTMRRAGTTAQPPRSLSTVAAAAAAAAAATAPLFTSAHFMSTEGPKDPKEDAAQSTSSAHSGRRGNFFAFFGFPKHPLLDGNALQKRYHALQLEVHPDKQQEPHEAAAPAGAEKAKSKTDISVYANVAYETLKDPFLRCRYLSQLERALELKNIRSGDDTAAVAAAAATKDRAGWVALTPEEEEALAQEDDTRSVRIAEAAPLRPMNESFMEEVLAMNELIFGGDREDEHVRNQMIVLRRDLEERDEDYFERAVKLWDAGDYFEYYHLVLEWTYVTNALHHVKDRL